MASASAPTPPNIVADQPLDKGLTGVTPAFDNGSLALRDEMLLGTPRHIAEIRRAIAEYYGMISHMDEWIGKIHDGACEIGELEDTLIIHTADHGLAVGQHGLLGKQNLYNHSVEVPLILAGPGIPAGRTDGSLCYQHDLHPTILRQAGISSDSNGFFRSLFPSTPQRPSRENVGTAFAGDQRMIRDSRYKLIEYGSPIRRTQLFDLDNDPWETRNLADDFSHESVVRDLRLRLEAWQKSTGDRLRLA